MTSIVPTSATSNILSDRARHRSVFSTSSSSSLSLFDTPSDYTDDLYNTDDTIVHNQPPIYTTRCDILPPAILHNSQQSLLHRRFGIVSPRQLDITTHDLKKQPSACADQVQIVGSPDTIGSSLHQFLSKRDSYNRYPIFNETILEESESDFDEDSNSDMASDSTDSIAVETAPNSPPELSFSKSSKSSSSSLRSSSIDDVESDSIGSPHFEELSLDEPVTESIEHVIGDNNLKPESRPTLRRPPPRSIHTMDMPCRGTMQAGTNFAPHPYRPRQMSPSRRRSDGVLQNQSTNLPAGSQRLRRVHTSQPALAMPHQLERRLSNSSAHDSSVPPSPASLASTTPRASQEATLRPSQQLSRKSSRQSIRKTVAELEAEYNDDDEDVPEEAILENVPISPLPGKHLHFNPMNRAQSPRRPPISPRSPSYTNLHSANVPKQARRPSSSVRRPSRSPFSPHNRPPMLQHSNTIGAFPPEQSSFNRKQRSKSWNDDLNEEARQLSIALDQFAANEKRSSLPNSVSASPERHSEMEKKPKSTITELPPMQKGNVMIDPLPISKEKEAVLTRTRPSWLPPKSQKEEKKHLKEWQQMMARAAQAEKKRSSKEKDTIEREANVPVNMQQSVWELDILRNWGTAKTDEKVKELCWRGIAPMSRGAIWKQAIGNELALSSSSFRAALNRARTLEDKLDSLPAEEFSKSKEAAWLSAIERDVPTVFPEFGKFAPDTAANQALSDVLKAYAMYRSDVGYVYGTHLIAGLLCLNLRADDAFVTLANLLNRPIPLAFLIHDTSSMQRTYNLVLNALKQKNAKLHDHLTRPELELAPAEYLDPLFRCLFAYNLSLSYVSRVWDAYVVEGDQVLIHAAAAILGLLESRLYTDKAGILEVIGWRNRSALDVKSEQVLMDAVKSFKS